MDHHQNTTGTTPEVACIKRQQRKGTLAGVACYLIWGFMALYWKQLDDVNPLEIICHRIIWCAVFCILLCIVCRWDFLRLFKERRAWCFLGPAAIIITLNWSIYIYAVSIDHIVETSLGYYINPLVTILLGLLIFKEHLTPLKWIAVGLCTVGIVYFTVSYGRFPLIGLLLALTFGVYGAIKKKGGYPAAEAITFESTVMVVPAVVMLLALLSITDSHAFLSDGTLEGIKTSLLLIGAGIATAVPLILFARAANLIPLTILGFIQYLSPTISLLIGVFVNHEAFTLAHAVCFGCIWGGLALVAIDSLFASKRSRSR